MYSYLCYSDLGKDRFNQDSIGESSYKHSLLFPDASVFVVSISGDEISVKGMQEVGRKMEWKILIVDDEIHLLDSVSRFLRQEGFKTETVSDGWRAPMLLKESSADLVLLDWMMPEKNGLEICRDIRSFSDVPIIFFNSEIRGDGQASGTGIRWG